MAVTVLGLVLDRAERGFGDDYDPAGVSAELVEHPGQVPGVLAGVDRLGHPVLEAAPDVVDAASENLPLPRTSSALVGGAVVACRDLREHDRPCCCDWPIRV